MQTNEPRQLVISFKSWQWFFLGIIVTFMIFGGISSCYQGRDISRYTGRAVRIDLPDDLRSYEDIVSISFHKNADGETVKDVTYIATDGLLHSKEFNDWGILQGEIIWELQYKAE